MNLHAFFIGLTIGLICIVLVAWGRYSGCVTYATILCVSNPINEMVVNIQKAQAGIKTATDPICMEANEFLSADALMRKVTYLESVTFTCKGDPVCQDGDPIEASPNEARAVNKARFKGVISCEKLVQEYACTIEIQSA